MLRFDICDDFEAPMIDPTLWSVDTGVTRDATFAHGGSASIRAHSDALAVGGIVTARLLETQTLAVETRFWVRGWFLLSALPAPGNNLALLAAKQDAFPFDGISVFVSSDDTHLYNEFDSSRVATSIVPTDTWFCLVWSVARSTAPDGTVALSGDTIAPITIPGSITDDPMPIASIRLGIQFASANVTAPQPPLDVWVDDVIIDSAPITCAD